MKQGMRIMMKPQPNNQQSYDPKNHDNECKLLWQAAWEEHKDNSDGAILRQDINAAHKEWCSAIEQNLHTLLYFEHNKYQEKMHKRSVAENQDDRVGQANGPPGQLMKGTH